PISTGSFIYLAVLNTFTNNLWHRVVPGFVIQGGDPSKTGWGGPGYDIISEFSPLNYNEGIVGMASAGKDTEGSQFFIMQAEHPHLNGRYTIFAEVVEGITIVSNLEQNDLILSIVLE
ncbi:MAG: peptidylprolyl isomerase, partial [Ignavibacteriaceae bacterium]|nr:peptidylprolyl isomerase [Ignavibacteriaceae bacterium]